MKTSAVALLLAAAVLGADSSPRFRQALPGYEFQFPRDHFNHPEFRTEWWYYTGNLRATGGKRFGFELTFFRHAVEPKLPENANVWDVRDVWMAHLALSDIDGGRFLNTDRLNRSGAGMAGVDGKQGLIWNGNWKVEWKNSGQRLQAVAEEFSLDLAMRSQKPPAVHGANGVSQKAAGAGRASHYVSLTRIATQGIITLDGQPYQVEGLSWMDHEFFSHSLESNQAGWDWFSLQFDDGSDLMLYRIRLKDGTVEPYSSGTYIDAAGGTQTLKASDFHLIPGRTWTSPKTKARYPIEWTVSVPSLNLSGKVVTRLPQQELASKSGLGNIYWEGAVEIEGQRGPAKLTGRGYLEMTGYSSAIRMGD